MGKLIDGDKLISTLVWGHYGIGKQLQTVQQAIDDMRGEDAVPVIRCKDCKYYREDGDCWHEWDNDGRIYYQSIITEPNPDDYCSRAERAKE